MMKRLWLVLGALGLLGAAPAVVSFGSNAQTAASTSVTVSATPIAANTIVAAVFINNAAASFQGSWTTACTGTNGSSTYTIAYRALVSGDTASTTVQVLATPGPTNVVINAYTISGTFTPDGCGTAFATGTGLPAASVTLNPAYNADLALAFGSAYFTGSTLSQNLTYTQCSGYSTDTTNFNGGAAARIGGALGNKTSIATPTTCSMLFAYGGTGTPASGKTSAGLLLLQNGTPLCLGNLLLLGVGC